MSYTPTNWKDGDIVTAEKLNKLENGVAGGGTLIIHINVDELTGMRTLDKTLKEINDAFMVGKVCIVVLNDNPSENTIINHTVISEMAGGIVSFYTHDNGTVDCLARSENEYPIVPVSLAPSEELE